MLLLLAAIMSGRHFLEAEQKPKSSRNTGRALGLTSQCEVSMMTKHVE